MGTDKFLLCLPNGFLHDRLLHELEAAFPNSKSMNISLHDQKQANSFNAGFSEKVKILFDLRSEHIGPAAGLLAAYEEDHSAYWAVLACDHPLMTHTELARLYDNFEEPVTCFKNSDGYVEPLVGIWSPTALQKLKENVRNSQFGPSKTFKQLGGKSISPLNPQTLFNTNTKDEWEQALQFLLDSPPKA